MRLVQVEKKLKDAKDTNEILAEDLRNLHKKLKITKFEVERVNELEIEYSKNSKMLETE